MPDRMSAAPRFAGRVAARVLTGAEEMFPMPNSYNRNREQGSRPYRQYDYDQPPSRQPQQFQREAEYDQYDDTQMFESDYRIPRSERFETQRPSGSYSQGSRDYDPLGDYDRAAALASRQSNYRGEQQNQSYFRGDDFGGGDFSADMTRGYGARSWQARGYGGSSGLSIPPRQYNPNDRGFFDRASDEVMSWFGDDDAASRRRRDHRDHRGRGPSNYKKSDERLLEDSCERLTNDYAVDASNINVTVASGEVTLDGTVDSRQAKRRAEDCVDGIAGVKHVQNNLRVVETASSWSSTSSTGEDR